MKTRVMWIVTITVVLVAPGAQARGGRETPIRMSGTLSESAVPDVECRGFRNATTGTVSGRPLGRATWSSSECNDVTAEPGAFTIRDARFSLKTRAGTLAGTYEARGGAVPGASGRVYVWGPFAITEGSGAYEGVTGEGLLAADADFFGTVRVELSGSLRWFAHG